MNRTLLHQTRFAIQVVIEDDTGTIAAFLAAITALLDLAVEFGHGLATVILTIIDLVEAVAFILTVWGIGLRSLAYGIGLRL